MNQQFLKEIEKGSKSALVKKRIITHYIYNGSSTIPDLSKELDLSVPTVTKFIGEMCNNPLFDESTFRALFYFFQELLVHNYAYLVIHTKIINFFINTWF